MTMKELNKLGFVFDDITLQEAQELELTNIETEYNECGGYLIADNQFGNEVTICFNENSDEMYEWADKIERFITTPTACYVSDDAKAAELRC